MRPVGVMLSVFGIVVRCDMEWCGMVWCGGVGGCEGLFTFWKLIASSWLTSH